MLVQMSTSIPKWLSNILTPSCSFKRHGFRIPTIWAESPILTASYYREYLRFRMILKIPVKNGSSILLWKQTNLFWVKSVKSNEDQPNTNDNNNQRITIHISKINEEYLNLTNKVWVVKPMSLNGNVRMFIIKDCNGMEIVYTN